MKNLCKTYKSLTNFAAVAVGTPKGYQDALHAMMVQMNITIG